MSTEVINKAQEIIASVEIPERHSYFQIEKFMIGSQPTAQAQLWQITREVKTRLENVQAITLQIEETNDVIEELGIKILLKEIEIERLKNTNADSKESELITGGIKIEIRKLRRSQQSARESVEKLEKKVKYIIEEVSCLTKGYDAIIQHAGPVKSWDDQEAQKEMWNEKFLEEFNLRVILNRPLETEFVKSVLSLDDDAPVKKHVIGLIERIQKQMISEQKRLEAANAALKPQVEVKAKIQREYDSNR
jgi:hypothetical protein